VLQEGTTMDNLLDRLHAALLTAAAHQAKDDPEDAKDGADAGNSGASIQQPDVAMMSLESRAALAWAEKQHRTVIRKRLDDLLRNGQCTPAEKSRWDAGAGAVKLSLDPETGTPASSRIEEFLDSREAVPKGTFWSAEQRTRMAREQVVEPPASMRGELSNDEIADLTNWALGRKGK
jgi:hypothetical protein